MKNTMRMLSLALCVLPMYLHAGTGQDLKQDDQPAQGQNARSAAPIPAGTIIPVSLNSHLALGQERKRRRGHGHGHAGRNRRFGRNPA